MHYLRISPLIIAVSTSAIVSAAPAEIAKTVGDLTLGVVLPTMVPNVPIVGMDVPMGGGAGGPSGGLPGNGLGTGSRAAGLSSGPALPHTPALPAKPPNLPGTGSLPVRRDPGHGNARLQPRQIHSADFSAAPGPYKVHGTPQSEKAGLQSRQVHNTDFSIAANPDSKSGALPQTSGPQVHKRLYAFDTGDHGFLPQSKREVKRDGRPQIARPTNDGHLANSAATGHGRNGISQTSPDATGSPAGQMAEVLKTVAILPSLAGSVAGAMPAAPGIPFTSADTKPTIDAADPSTLPPAAPAPVAEKPKEAVNKEAYVKYPTGPDHAKPLPTEASATAETKTKRHSFVLDTDPLIPPGDDMKAQKDPAMGLINMDSNAKPEPPVEPPHKNATVTAAASSSSKPAPTSTAAMYQPSEPGYAKSYPT